MSHISLRLSFFFFGRSEYTLFFLHADIHPSVCAIGPFQVGFFFFLLKEKEKDLRRRVVGWGRPRHLSDPTAQKLKIRLLASYSSPPPPPPASPSQSWLFRRGRTSCAPLAVGSDRDHSCSGCLQLRRRHVVVEVGRSWRSAAEDGARWLRPPPPGPRHLFKAHHKPATRHDNSDSVTILANY